MANDMQWYDSLWLGKYFTARDIVARVAPNRLAQFVEAFAVFRTDPAFTVKYLPKVLDARALADVRQIVRSLPREKLEMHELKRFGRFVIHELPVFNELQQTLVDKVSEWAGEEVEPSYNFLSLYTHKGVCEPHLDSPSAKWTLDICIGQSDPWPIYLSQILPWPDERLDLGDDWQNYLKRNPDIAFSSEAILPGDAIFFSGSSQWHYRDPMQSGQSKSFCDLLFFHFIPKGTAELLKPANWSKLFGVPELADIPGMDRRM